MVAIDTIVVPQGAEYQAVCRGLRQGKIANVRVVAIPLGSTNIRQILAGYANELRNSRQILIIGLCGSLDKSYVVGDRVLVKSCEDPKHNLLYLDPALTATIQEKLLIDLVPGLTSVRIISQAQEKYELSQRHRVKIVEMEGFGYVRELQRQGKSVAMLRVVSDDLTGDIPNLSNTIDSQGKIGFIPMAIAFSKQPIAAIRLIRGSLAGLKALEQITLKLFT